MSSTSSTMGNRNSLDFIPGNNFLGIVAKMLYDKEDESTQLLFHSGHVRFGDAHPAYNGIRSIRIPADIYFPKYNGTEGEAYVYHRINDFDGVRSKQLKQGRTGFYALMDNTAIETPITKQFAIKSAYDTARRRSEDQRLFGYESLGKGCDFYFTIELDDVATVYKEAIIKALTGRRHIGRSRTAQYGWVEIKEEEFRECPTMPTKDNSDEVAVYADGRLIFFDEQGTLTLQPTAQQLGFQNGFVEWNKSQIRTFQYAPWNYKRHAFDSDRYGIEKGSVFIVKTTDQTPINDYVGAYQNEGFGKVIYNPAILHAESDNNGRATVKFEKGANAIEDEDKSETKSPQHKYTPLMAYLFSQKQKHDKSNRIYDNVYEWVDRHQKLFQGDSFASQWGTIRGIAMATNDDNKILDNINEYLSHGIAKKKWEERGRHKALKDFLKGKDNIRELVITLASEMGKKCKTE